MIDILKLEIEKRMKMFASSPAYHGCMTEEIRGMLDALNIITCTSWIFDRDFTLIDAGRFYNNDSI